MPGFVVETDSLIDVANSLATLDQVLHSISTDYVNYSATDLGGQVIGQQVTGFNDQWMYGVSTISGEVGDLQRALYTAAAHYEHTEQIVSQGSHDQPSGRGPGTAASHHKSHDGHHRHKTHHHQPPHTHADHHHEHHAKRHDTGTGMGTTTIGGPRVPVTGTGTGTTTIGGAPERHSDHDKGSGTTTIGPGGVSTTVHTGPGRGYGTTIIGGDADEDDATVASAFRSGRVHPVGGR